MEFLIILALVAAVIFLWKQLEALQRRVAVLENAEPPSTVRTITESAPRIALKRNSDDDEALASASATYPDEPVEKPNSRISIVSATTPKPMASLLPADHAANEENLREADDEGSTEESPSEPRKRFDIEDIFGRRLPIWVGGITLAIAGVLLVRYSIEAGLVTPPVRVAMAFLFGLVLFAGAEFTYRKAEAVNDPRICQALAGAGLATLYAAFYLAGTQYGLIGQTLAFVGLAAVTAAAIGLSFRFGLPCAVLGLVGGFAAPLLVGGDEANLPLLTIYLGLVAVGLTQAGERQGRPWLSLAALGVGLGWGLLLLFTGEFGTAEVLALGFYLLLLGAILPSLMSGGAFARPVRLASAFLASLQLALLVDRAGDGLLAWSLYLLMGATLAGLAWRRSELREGSAVAMVIAIGLLTQWDPAVGWAFYAIASAIGVIFIAMPLVHLWNSRDTFADCGQIAGGPLALAASMFVVAGDITSDAAVPALAAAFTLLATFPAVAAWFARSDDGKTLWHALFSAASAMLLLAALLMVTPSWTAPLMATAIFMGLMLISRGRSDLPIRSLLCGAGIVLVLTLFASDGAEYEMGRLFMGQHDGFTLRAVLRWAAMAIGLGAFVWHSAEAGGRVFAVTQVGTALAGYGLAAQLLPDTVLPWGVALAVIALRFVRFTSSPSQLALAGVAALWAVAPLMEWIEGGLEAFTGAAPLMSDWPTWDEALLRIAPLAAALFALPGYGLRKAYIPAGLPRAVGLGVALVTVHTLYKYVFALETRTEFIASALAERTIWQALLLAAAFTAMRMLPRVGAQPAIAAVLAGLSLAHLVWFTGVVHNPLFTEQAVGPVPLANLVLALGAVGLVGAWCLRKLASEQVKPALDAIAMITIVICALALLRQVFSGTVLTAVPMGQTEDLLRSLIGIVLAIAFLLFGRVQDTQSWRIGSLLLMLIAVAKVFLIDAAALEGLIRIASFMALGFSLLGIGWLYARQLGPRNGGDEAKPGPPGPSR